MDEKKIERINFLARKKRSEGLTEEELKEQQELRQEYIQAVRANLRGQLESIKIQNPDGTMVDVKERHDKKYNAHE